MSVSAEELKELRLRLGESQTRFGERFGIKQSTVARWEAEGPPSRGAAGKAIELVLSEIGSV